MQYGYFDDKKREYVITNPKTPVKWTNYIGTLKFGGLVDQTGGAVICKGDPALNRITKYIPQLPVAEMKGETLYLRFLENGQYRVFSPFFVPTLDPYQRYECRIGLLYTRFITEFYGIRSEITVFVPVNGQCEIRDITITNISDTARAIDLIPVVEYSHFDILKQFTNADWVPQTMQSRIYQDSDNRKILTQYAFIRRDTHVNYFTSNYPVSSFESDRKLFLGDNEYANWNRPLSLFNEELSCTEANRGDNIGALLHHLGELKPGESRRVITQLGQDDTIKKALININRYRNEKEVDGALAEIQAFWDEYLDKMQVETPDENMNTMLNIHNPRQCYITKNWSRDLSLYQLGFGTRGIGFRDSSQDVMGIMTSRPEEGREFIEKLLQMQKCDGSAVHQFFASTMEAGISDAYEKPDRPQFYGDDHLWSILAVCSYLKESGNLDFLHKIIPFYDKTPDKKPLENASIMDHLQRAIEFTYANKGRHDLPLVGFADWNDTVNLHKGAESLFIANQYGFALKEMIELAEYINDQNLAAKYRQYYQEMKTAVNQHAWDGEWFVRYFDYDGTALGSHTNDHGRIYVNSQSWAVISGFAGTDHGRTAMNAVYKYLNTAKGIKLSTPGFNGYEADKGGITTYPPGAKENGGIFLHTNPWAMIAETIMGYGERAFEYYRQINPAGKNEIIDEYECEPYCYAQNLLGDEHPQFGLARNSWLSGTASWVYQAATRYILGIRPVYQGLIIDPCIPKSWIGFTVKRLFRGCRYEIRVNNPGHISKGIKGITVDGQLIKNNIVPVFNDGKIHQVVAEMG